MVEYIIRKKYQYIIECNGSGGELSIHSITQEFFDFMDAMSEDEKNDCITKLYQDQASLESLPQIKPDEENNEYFEWHEGDIKHVSLPSEIELSVFEVPLAFTCDIKSRFCFSSSKLEYVPQN